MTRPPLEPVHPRAPGYAERVWASFDLQQVIKAIHGRNERGA